VSDQLEDAPKQADFLLKEADAVRAEIVYKMQLAHRISLTILIAPNAVLPAMAKLVEQIGGTGPNKGLGDRAALFNLMLVVVAACLPLLLLWANLFCHSQVNGIRRAGDWLRNLERRLDLGSTCNGWSGWETWVSESRRRLLDDDLYRQLRESLVFLYYFAAAGMASFLVGKMLQNFQVSPLLGVAADKAKAFSYGAPAFIFAATYVAIAWFRIKTTYTGDSTDTDEWLALVEPAIINAARQAYRQPAGVLKFPYVVGSAGEPLTTEADPLRMLGESSRVLGSYQELYDWDGIFCGGALVHEPAPLDQVLEGVVRNFLTSQSGDGFVPKSLTHDGKKLDPGELCKPLLAQGALAVSRARGGHGWLDKNTFNALVAFVEHWLRERRGPSGMFKWRSALESGVDNNAVLVHFPPLSIEAVDATCFVARECAALALLAEECANTPVADRMRRSALDAQHALLRSWDEDAGIFWNRHVDSDLPVKVMSWTGLMPMWGGFVPKRMRARLVKEHLRPGGPFLTTYGIMTLARKEVAFNNGRRTYIWDHTAQARKEVSNWQGPTWVLPNALIADALAAAGHRSLAQTICRGTLMLLAHDLRESGSMHECYDADSGAPLWASGFLSWNALGLGMSRWLRGRSPTILPAGLSSLSVELR
jgi:mannosylglycerate hydrolase MGH1-like protein